MDRHVNPCHDRLYYYIPLWPKLLVSCALPIDDKGTYEDDYLGWYLDIVNEVRQFMEAGV